MIGQALLAHLSCIGELSVADGDAIRALKGEVRTIQRHSDVLSRGDVPRFVVIVLKGLLCRYATSAKGTRQIQSFYIPTDAPSLESLHLDYIDSNLGTIVSSVVALVPHANIFRLMEDRPAVAALAGRAALLQGSTFREWLTRNCTQPADASMAHLFCEMFVRADAAGLISNGSCELPITQENLAEALGLTAVHANRTLQVLRETGLVEFKLGRLSIFDLPRLAHLAHFDPHYLHLRRGEGAMTPQKAAGRRGPVPFMLDPASGYPETQAAYPDNTKVTTSP